MRSLWDALWDVLRSFLFEIQRIIYEGVPTTFDSSPVPGVSLRLVADDTIWFGAFKKELIIKWVLFYCLFICYNATTVS